MKFSMEKIKCYENIEIFSARVFKILIALGDGDRGATE